MNNRVGICMYMIYVYGLTNESSIGRISDPKMLCIGKYLNMTY